VLTSLPKSASSGSLGETLTVVTSTNITLYAGERYEIQLFIKWNKLLDIKSNETPLLIYNFLLT
jgi:hypothetical protein